MSEWMNEIKWTKPKHCNAKDDLLTLLWASLQKTTRDIRLWHSTTLQAIINAGLNDQLFICNTAHTNCHNTTTCVGCATSTQHYTLEVSAHSIPDGLICH